MAVYDNVISALIREGVNPNELTTLRRMSNVLVRAGIAKNTVSADAMLKRLPNFAWYPGTDEDVNYRIRHTTPVGDNGNGNGITFFRYSHTARSAEEINQLVRLAKDAPIENSIDVFKPVSDPQRTLASMLTALVWQDERLQHRAATLAAKEKELEEAYSTIRELKQKYEPRSMSERDFGIEGFSLNQEPEYTIDL